MRYAIRRISAEDLTPVTAAFFEFAFPGFFYKPASEDVLRKRFQKDGIDPKFFEEADIPISFNVRLPRRYAGDIFEFQKGVSSSYLPRQRYASLIGMDGTDSGVLKCELLAYAGMGNISFSLIERSEKDYKSMLGFEPKDGEYLVVLQFDDFAAKFIDYLHSMNVDVQHGGIVATNTRLLLISLPFRKDDIELGKVMDLRLPEDRRTFFEIYYHGVPGFFEWPEGKADNFLGMLTHLYFQALGGSIILEAIGAHLRLDGYEGLVYPSARANCGVEIVNGQLENFYGFNLVIYKDAPVPEGPKSFLTATYCPWTHMMPCQEFKVRFSESVDYNGSFWVSGIWEMANRNKSTMGYYYDTDSSKWPPLDVLILG